MYTSFCQQCTCMYTHLLLYILLWQLLTQPGSPSQLISLKLRLQYIIFVEINIIFSSHAFKKDVLYNYTDAVWTSCRSISCELFCKLMTHLCLSLSVYLSVCLCVCIYLSMFNINIILIL